MYAKTFDMQELETICPYTGLRPFTEEESLYFKGRDEQIIKLTELVERKKFLMVTGASGDGKSSLVFAGLIPQARAGFFHAQYSNWHVASFRPERSPLKNMAQSLAEQLKMDAETVSVELSRGFSSLVELYKSSTLFIDVKGQEWIQSDEDKKNQMERQAGNLLIIIDQFEEFFTNPENFPNGVPSLDSRLLLNIILETSKISLKEDLPIYVVCTMRSDYIGQCAAFRGLPEFIGFSQFFVPRLQRKELQQVIEEPAILSGNRISKRLTDRLIYDLEEGLDQLPILQHALKQIWKAADQGNEELDLIHYAMVGGMSGGELPMEDFESFLAWQAALPVYEKEYLQHPGLSNVLDIHANKLYEEAADYYNKNAVVRITPKEAKFIIGLSLSCLTRIDENRAVRNRMSLEEITQIINVSKLTTEVVGGVLNIFREGEHTLIRPFLDDSCVKSAKADPSIILDITHEALIRNWTILKKWAAKENEYHSVYLDFKQQLQRWIENGKSSDYLLPIGPLTYFENWVSNCRPNQYWFNRYNESEISASEKLKESSIILNNTQKFLRRSSLQLIITRLFMKFGARRIAVATGMVILLGLSGFLIYNWHIRQNEFVLYKLIVEGASLLHDKETSPDFKGNFVMLASRLDTANLALITKEVPNNNQKIEIALKIFENIFFTSKESNPSIRINALNYADSLVRISVPSPALKYIPALNATLNNLNDLIRNELYNLQFKPNKKLQKHFEFNVKVLRDIISEIMNTPSFIEGIDNKALNIGIENSLNLKAFSQNQIKEMTTSISPFEGKPEVIEKFERYFPAQAKLNVGFRQTVSHNGGYEKLAYLYAAQGNVSNTLRCLDSLNTYNEQYDQNWNNSTNIAAYFLMYGHTKSFLEFIAVYSKRLNIPKHSFLKEMCNVAGIQEYRRIVKSIKHGNYNLNLELFDFNQVNELFGFYKSILVDDAKDKDELNFGLALLYKQQGVVCDKLLRDSGHPYDTGLIDSLFTVAFNLYSKVSNGFLNGNIEIFITPWLGGKENRVVNRNYLFIYPDHFIIGEAFTNPGFFRFYGDAFFRFLLQRDVFHNLYHTEGDYRLIAGWINSYFELYNDLYGRVALNYTELKQNTFLSVDSLFQISGYTNTLDDAWINLYLANEYFEKGDTTKAFSRVKRLKFLEFNRVSGAEDGPFHNVQMKVANQLAVHGKRKEAIWLASQFKVSKNRMMAYSKLASFTKLKGLDTESEIYLDSARSAQNQIKYFRINTGNSGIDYRTGMIEILTLQDDHNSTQEARIQISAISEAFGNMGKLNAVIAMVRTQARMNHYYDARLSIPELANAEDKLKCINEILYVEVLKRSGTTETAWATFDKVFLGWVNFTDFLYDLFEY